MKIDKRGFDIRPVADLAPCGQCGEENDASWATVVSRDGKLVGLIGLSICEKCGDHPSAHVLTSTMRNESALRELAAEVLDGAMSRCEPAIYN